MHLLIFGLGYTGTALAQLAASRHRTTVVTRQMDAAAPDGVQLAPFSDPPFGTATHMVLTAAPGESGDPVLAQHAAAIAAAPLLRWTGYMSTTGRLRRPRRRLGGRNERDRAIQRARTAARDGGTGLGGGAADMAVDLLRLAGIYGPGRSVFDDLRAGRAAG